MAEIIEAEIKSNVGEFAQDAEKAAKATEDIGKGAKKAKGGVKQLGVGFKSLAKASGIVFVITEAFNLFKEVLGQNQTVMDAFKTGTTALSIAFNDLFGFISNNIGTVVQYFKNIFDNPKESLDKFAKAIKENLMERFQSWLDMIGHLGKAIGHLFKGEFEEAKNSAIEAGKEMVDTWTGVDNSIDKVTKVVKKAIPVITEYTKSTVNQAKSIVATEKAANRAALEFEKLNAQYLKEAEEQRQIRDDVNASFADRLEANEKLNKILEEQQAAQREQIQSQIDAAQAQYDINASEENFLELERQKIEMLKLEETITGQLSEQKTNQVALENELLAAQREIRAEGMSGMERELEELENAYKEKVKLADQAGEETTALDAKYAEDRKKIIQANVNDQMAAYSQLSGALSSLFGDNKELAAASAIIDTYVGANKAFAVGGPAGFATGAAIIAAGLNNVKKIYETGDAAGGGGGGAVPSTPAPALTSGAFDLSGVAAPEPVQAYVVTDDMTNSQNKLETIRRRATI
jgi:hypothetical protein